MQILKQDDGGIVRGEVLKILIEVHLGLGCKGWTVQQGLCFRAGDGFKIKPHLVGDQVGLFGGQIFAHPSFEFIAHLEHRIAVQDIKALPEQVAQNAVRLAANFRRGVAFEDHQV